MGDGYPSRFEEVDRKTLNSAPMSRGKGGLRNSSEGPKHDIGRKLQTHEIMLVIGGGKGKTRLRREAAKKGRPRRAKGGVRGRREGEFEKLRLVLVLNQTLREEGSEKKGRISNLSQKEW